MISFKFFLTILLSIFIPQIIKVIISLIKKEKKNILDVLMETGGMPSSHAALVSGITTLIYLVEGITTIFFVSLMVSFIVMRDAYGVRLSSGNQAKTINKLIELENKKNKNSKLEYLEIVKGHTQKEVFVGAILGIIITITIFYAL